MLVTLLKILQNWAGEKKCSKSCCSKQERLGVDKEKKYRKITLLEAAKTLPACIVSVQEEKKLLEN